MARTPLVSVGLPVYNGVKTIESVVRSVLAQEYERLELVISDNASTDGTEELCRDLAATDPRIVYVRQPRNVGLLNNFIQAIQRANGTYFRWIGDDDWLAPAYITRCLDAFEGDPRVILVTTQMDYTNREGVKYTYDYRGTALQSDDPIVRFRELVTMMVYGMRIDPLYGLMHRQTVLSFPRRNMIREDEIFATKLVLAGPWSHVPEVLAHRHVAHLRLPLLVRRLGVPQWQAYLSNTLQCREMLRIVSDADLTASQRRRARAAVAGLFVGRHYRKVSDQSRKVIRMLSSQH